ncbi:hypothetical protein QF000_006066 [Paraburkholderia atlantica]
MSPRRPAGSSVRAGFERALRDDVETLPAALVQPRVARRAPHRLQSREQLAGLRHTEFDEARAQRVVGAIVGERAAPHPRGRAVLGRAAAVAAAHLVGENLVELLFDELAMRVELRHQFRIVVAAHRARERRAVFCIDGHRVSLRVVAILQTMFELAQKAIRLRQLHAHRGVHQPMRGRVAQHRERRPHAKAGVLAAADQLEHLRAEFDFTDAAAAELDVVGLVGAHRRTALRLLADLQMQRADRADHAEIQIASIDERRDDRVELLLQPLRRGAHSFGYEPALDPRVTLPLAALHVEILFQHAEAAHQRARIAVRPQTHIDTKHVAVGGDLRERADQPLAEPREELLGRERRALAAGGLAVVLVDEDQIDIRRHVQLAAAELAHADHAQREPLALLVARLAIQRFELGAQHR